MKNRIAELRRKYNMNQRELGEKLSVGQTTVSAWERGQNEPDSEALSKMASMFDASMEYIMGYGTENYKQGLSEKQYSKVQNRRTQEREQQKEEREIEQYLKKEERENLGTTDKELAELEEAQLYADYQNAGKADTFEGYKASRMIDERPKAQRDKLISILEFHADLLDK